MSLFSGLTVTLSRDATSGDYALEAGALVLADQGMKNNGILIYMIIAIIYIIYIPINF